MKALLLCVCLVPLAVLAKTQPQMQTAKVILQNIGSYNAGAAIVPVGNMLVAGTIKRQSNIVVIETKNHRITLQEFWKDRHPLLFAVNGTTQFYQDGDYLVFLDSHHKRHKFSIVHLEVLNK